MDNTSNTKNYVAHGGGEWVIGGKLTFLPGAVVEGGEGLFDGAAESGTARGQIAFIPDSTATNATQLRESFNGLLAALRTAGIMAPAEVMKPASEETDAGT